MPIVSLCGSVGANTGKIQCDIRRGKPLIAILGSHKFTPSEIATTEAFKAALLANMKLNNGNSEKMFPFPNMNGITNNTAANTEGTLGDGTIIVLSEGAPGFTAQALVGINTEKQIRKFNSSLVPVIIFDNKGNFWGSEDSDGNFVGTEALVFTTGKPYSDGTSVETEVASISFRFTSAADFFDNAAVVETDMAANQLEGLLDVFLSEASVSNTNVRKISVKVKNASKGKDISMFDKYQDELSDVSLWKASVGTTFQTTLVITSIVKDSTLKAWTITFDSTAYTALTAGAKIKLELVGPEQLDDENVIGIEGSPLILTKV